MPREADRAHEEIEGGAARISSFAALDELLLSLVASETGTTAGSADVRRRSFSNLRRVVLAGFSGGGQFVQRYALAGGAHAALAEAGVAPRYDGYAAVVRTPDPLTCNVVSDGRCARRRDGASS